MPRSRMLNRQVILSSRSRGIPQERHFSIVDIAVEGPADGQILICNEYWSVDPAMRSWPNDAPNYSPSVEIGAPMRSLAVGSVIERRHPEYRSGDVVTGMFGWQSHTVCDADLVDRKVEQTALPMTLALGMLSLNGVIFGLLDICDPRKVETVVVSTGAGAVGSVVGQIARMRGCRVGASRAPGRRLHCASASSDMTT